MLQFIPAPYTPVNNCHRVYKNNFSIVDSRYRLWKYVFDYSVEQPKLEPVPIKYKGRKGLSLFRYMSASHFLKDAAAGSISFISPALWNDPFERLFFREPIQIGQIQYSIRCICLTYDWIESEEAAWLRSSVDNEMVRVEYDFEKLCSELNKMTDVDFYFSVIDYSLPRKDIIKLANDFKNGKWAPKTIDDYLNVMSLKRKAFIYENEIRLFLVKKQPIDSDIISLDYQTSPIVSVCLPPKKPSQLEEVKKAKERYGIDVKQSRLYDIKK